MASHIWQPQIAHFLSAGYKLDPYKRLVRDRLEEFLKLSAQRLFEEVCTAGYPGGYSCVRDHVWEVRPGEPLEPVVRFETPPSRQSQVDFGELLSSLGA